MSARAEACAFRVVQEGLTNALRHAPGGSVRILLQQDHGRLDVLVETTGKRRASSYGGGGRGLSGLRERVASLGGSLETAVADNGDFTLRVALPAGAR